MPKNTFANPYDLTSPDGSIREILKRTAETLDVVVEIDNISPSFKGFEIDKGFVHFNVKSTFAQLGIDGFGEEYLFSPKFNKAKIKITLRAFTPVGRKLLTHITEGVYVGRLFAADERRRVRSPDYLKRLLGKSDSNGHPLLILNEEYSNEEIMQDKEHNRVIVNIPLLPGQWIYDEAIIGFLPTIAKGLLDPRMSFRKFLFLHQKHILEKRVLPKDSLLLVRTITMSIRTLFAKVVRTRLPDGYHHANADIICPQQDTGDIFEFHGRSSEEISHIPLEFYTLEPHREHFFFSDRDLLQECTSKPELMFKAFESAPERRGSTFVVKGEQLLNLQRKDWIVSDPPLHEYLLIPPTNRKERSIIQDFIQSQAIYTIVKAMQEGDITSQGIILTNYLPTPILKSFLLNERVTRCLKAIYFKTPSEKHGEYFSNDDRTLLQDLAKAEIDLFWVDFRYKLLLKYVLRSDKDSGMFVPIDKEKAFQTATFFGIYGSKFFESSYYDELILLFKGLLSMQKDLDHEKFNPEVTIAITTGGGPGVMAMGNKIANELGILSCGHAVDFTKPHESTDHIEEMNPYIQAKMTYRLEQLIVRQAEFMLDFPLFFEGGVGTDFEFTLELLRTQVGNRPPAPILLFGKPSYWRSKITSTFQTNRKIGTIRGSEWVSNTFYCVQNHKEALLVYYKYFTNRLPIGKNNPPSDDGFITISV